MNVSTAPENLIAPQTPATNAINEATSYISPFVKPPIADAIKRKIIIKSM
jgi:hypothetical protein